MRSLIALFTFSTLVSFGQPTNVPRLVVGIVVDQMRYEYLYRFEKKFGDGGFRRLTSKGFDFKNAHYNYVPTYTGPGHASIYTGTTPAVHGIIGNDWYDKETKASVNCVEDARQKPVGTIDGNGDVSPWRMISSTVTDELELATQRRAKVIGISIKDRGAVLPAGHTPDGAYWYDSKTGKFISSTYYKPGLPIWLDNFNGLNLADKYLNQEWKTVFPIDQYKESGADDSPYEVKLKGKDKPVFPYNLKELRKTNGEFELLSSTPFSNDLLTELAKAALEGESMGKDEWSDFLSISFSAPDIIGHAMGPNSVEIEDTYIRLDRNLEDLFKKLDEIAPGQYVVFLTADHAVSEVPQSLKDLKIPAGNLGMSYLESGLTDFLKKYFPDKKLIEKISNDQVFLNSELFGSDPRASGVDYLVATELIKGYLLNQEGVADVFTKQIIQAAAFEEGSVKGKVKRGYHSKRSGDIAFVLEPSWLGGTSVQGTSHGSPYTYDTHVPMVFYGMGIKPGSSVRPQFITDIAPTLSVLLKIKFPSGCTGQPIEEIFK
jgi:predicted AlkP superfamily pyrophosphatase or phosphodiesterase